MGKDPTEELLSKTQMVHNLRVPVKPEFVVGDAQMTDALTIPGLKANYSGWLNAAMRQSWEEIFGTLPDFDGQVNAVRSQAVSLLAMKIRQDTAMSIEDAAQWAMRTLKESTSVRPEEQKPPSLTKLLDILDMSDAMRNILKGILNPEDSCGCPDCVAERTSSGVAEEVDRRLAERERKLHEDESNGPAN